jgi:hypothetical protein
MLNSDCNAGPGPAGLQKAWWEFGCGSSAMGRKPLTDFQQDNGE